MSIRVINYLSNANYSLPSVLLIDIFVLDFVGLLFIYLFYFKCISLYMVDSPTTSLGPRAETMPVLLFIISSVPGIVRST